MLHHVSGDLEIPPGRLRRCGRCFDDKSLWCPSPRQPKAKKVGAAAELKAATPLSTG